MRIDLDYLIGRMLGKKTANHRLAEVDVLSPYVSDIFFRQLNELTPDRVFLTTDAGCPQSDIERVRDLPGSRIETVQVGYCSGIVHGKFYVFHWQHSISRRFLRFLVWGSLNATDGGFGHNAEGVSWLCINDMEDEMRERLQQYFMSLRRGDWSAPMTEILHGGVTVILPNFRMEEQASNFDMWIQRGRICSPFALDANFRRLRIRLNQPIQRGDPLSAELERQQIGFNQQATLSFDYIRGQTGINMGDFDDDDGFTAQWKSRYFLYTSYGYWTSEECYKACGKMFYKADHEMRAREIERIAKASEADKQHWLNEFLDRLIAIANALPDARVYFHCDMGRLDVERYRRQFVEQINRHVASALTPSFKRRYISGYMFSEVPPMRESPALWEEYLLSFAESLQLEIQKRGSRNRLAQVSKAEGMGEWTEDAVDMLGELRASWNQHQRALRHFYEDVWTDWI